MFPPKVYDNILFPTLLILNLDKGTFFLFPLCRRPMLRLCPHHPPPAYLSFFQYDTVRSSNLHPKNALRIIEAQIGKKHPPDAMLLLQLLQFIDHQPRIADAKPVPFQMRIGTVAAAVRAATLGLQIDHTALLQIEIDQLLIIERRTELIASQRTVARNNLRHRCTGSQLTDQLGELASRRRGVPAPRRRPGQSYRRQSAGVSPGHRLSPLPKPLQGE